MNYQGLANFSFGALQCSFPGSIDLYDNALTVIDFGHITSVSGRIDLDFNDLTTVDFGRITSVGEYISLHDNDLPTINFGQITRVGDFISLHDNDLTSIDFDQITSVGGNIELQSNHRLTSVDCTGVAVNGCICVDDGVALINCPAKCNWYNLFWKCPQSK